MSDVPDDGLVPGLSEEVVERLRSELGARADRVLGCLRTAAALLAQAEADISGLRLAESAAYNLREALNHVVEGQDAAEGGLRAVMNAWQRYKGQTAVQGVDTDAAREELDRVLDWVKADESRASYYARRLLTYLQDRSGVSPLAGPDDPVSEYGELREKANTAVHDELPGADVAVLLSQTMAWFIRVFTPPDQVAEAIRTLAAQPWSGPEQIAELKRLATNDHHLRLFFSEVRDSAWLEALHEAGIAQAPSPNTPWPVAALLTGVGTTDPESVALLLERLLTDTARVAKDERAAARFELLRMSSQLGTSGHGIVVEVARLHSDLSAVRSLAVYAARKADATKPVVLDVADCVLNHFCGVPDGDRYHAVKILDHVQAGVTANNVVDRARVLAGKTGRLARSDGARYVVLGIEAFTAEPEEHPEPLVLFAHHLARILSTARRSGVPTSVQLEWLSKISGEVGERLRGHVLAGAEDIPLADKIAHITSRLESPTATAEDLALVADILSRKPAPEDLTVWVETLGTPSRVPADGDEIPRDWGRVWRWAAVLPEHVLTAWRGAIDSVSEHHGPPNPQALTSNRRPRWEVGFGQSPYSSEDLSARPPLDTAALVAAWEPDAESQWRMFGRLELARALGEAVKANPTEWSAAPQDIVSTLGNPLYVEHYFRGLTERAADIVSHAHAVLAAALAQPSASELHEGSDDTDKVSHDRDNTHEAVLDLFRELANKNADLAATLDGLWERAIAAVWSFPESDQGLLFHGHDALTSAINRSWGRGLQTALALAAWEFRNSGTVRPEFEYTLNAIIERVGSVGLEFRAILAAHRPLLEGISAVWLNARTTTLFREGTLAQETFDLTVKWARPTNWFYREFPSELFNAALREVDNAVSLIVAATLREVDGYELNTVMKRLGKVPAVLATAAADCAVLMQEAEPDSPHLAVAIRFWTLLLDADRRVVPARALTGLGRWAFVNNIDDDQWARLTSRTLDATDGQIDDSISVADRAAGIPPSSTSRYILLHLLDHGDLWERHHAASKSLDVLRASRVRKADDSFRRLRTRLIDLGHHETTAINPLGTTD